MSDELAHGFLLLCDKRLQPQADQLATVIRTTSGSIKLKTLDDVLEAKGSTFGKKLETVLNIYSHAVIIICSKGLADFIDKKDKTNCPDLIVKNFKDSQKVLKEFIKTQSKKIPTKIVLVALNDDTTVPKDLKGMEIVHNEGNEQAFHNHVIAEITSRMNEFRR